MTSYITTYDQWLSAFRKDKRSIWIKVDLSSGTQIYFKDYADWQDIKKTCESESLEIHAVSLQFKSNIIKVDTKDSDGVYLIRAIRGRMGGKSQHYYTIGLLREGVVHKGMWLTPELIEEENYEDTLDNCFEEAIIYNHARKAHTKESV